MPNIVTPRSVECGPLISETVEDGAVHRERERGDCDAPLAVLEKRKVKQRKRGTWSSRGFRVEWKVTGSAAGDQASVRCLAGPKAG